MKHIEKTDPPTEFEEWKALENQDWTPEFNNMTSEVKEIVKRALIREQGGLCCYCEKRIGMNDSHIEHFRPRNFPDVDPLDYSNLLCSCIKNPIREEVKHCGHFKGEWFDEILLIAPLDIECEDAFSFYGNGRILPAQAEDQAAQTTIKKLGLDCEKIIALRKGALDPFLDPDLEPSEFLEFVEGYLERRVDGLFNAHWSAVRYVFT